MPEERKICPNCISIHEHKLIYYAAGSRKNIKAAGGETVSWDEFWYCSWCNKSFNELDFK